MAKQRMYLCIFFFYFIGKEETIMKNTIDRTGQRINMLTAIERIPNYNETGKIYYKCKCDCGNIYYESNSHWNKAYSCGCITRRSSSQRIDYTGQKFNHLTVLEMLYKYKNNQTYARCICDCGQETIAYMGNIKSGKTKSCGCIEKSSRYNRKHVDNSIIGQRFGSLIFIKNSGKKEKNGSVLWECLCDCGNVAYVSSSKLKIGHTTSCGCAKKDYINSLKLDIIGKRFGLLKVTNEVFDSSYKRRMVSCQCDCGKEAICAVTDLTTGHTMSCGCLCKSKGEMFIEELLNEYNITYEPQKRFNDCTNKRKLPFDFYLPTYNLCIEYQGEQHYKPVEYWGGVEKFKVYKKNDLLKKEYCKKNNIGLLCLPYTLTNEEIKQEILNILDPVTTTLI